MRKPRIASWRGKALEDMDCQELIDVIHQLWWRQNERNQLSADLANKCASAPKETPIEGVGE